MRDTCGCVLSMEAYSVDVLPAVCAFIGAFVCVFVCVFMGAFIPNKSSRSAEDASSSRVKLVLL